MSSSEIEPSSARITPAKYRKWSIARGKSAAIVSRIALPLSNVSTAARCCRLASILSAILFRIMLLSVEDVCPQVLKASSAALTANSMSIFAECAAFAIGFPSTGESTSKY